MEKQNIAPVTGIVALMRTARIGERIRSIAQTNNKTAPAALIGAPSAEYATAPPGMYEMIMHETIPITTMPMKYSSFLVIPA